MIREALDSDDCGYGKEVLCAHEGSAHYRRDSPGESRKMGSSLTTARITTTARCDGSKGGCSLTRALDGTPLSDSGAGQEATDLIETSSGPS